MIYSKSYEILIRHEKSEITILNETNNKSVYKVYILSKDKKNIIIYDKSKRFYKTAILIIAG